MADDTIEIIFEEDPSGGPLTDHMVAYRPDDFKKYVVEELSDGNRREIVYESNRFVDLVKEAIGSNGTVNKVMRDTREPVRKIHQFRRKLRQDDLFAGDDVVGGGNVYGRFRQGTQTGLPHGTVGFSGAEFVELMQVAVAVAGSALTLPVIRATKDVVIKWLDGRSRRKVIIKEKGKTIEIHGPGARKQIDDVLERLEHPTAKPQKTSVAKKEKEAKKVSKAKKAKPKKP
jgi:hypothetical protein